MTTQQSEPIEPLNQSEPGEIEAQLKRAHADLANLQRRSVENETRARQAGRDRAVLALLPVIDTIERAFDHLSPETRQTLTAQAGCTDWLKGVEAVRQQAEQTMQALGYRQIESSNQSFNPSQHEAIGTDSQPKQPDGLVLQTIQAGWLTPEGQALRPALVIVNKPSQAGA